MSLKSIYITFVTLLCTVVISAQDDIITNRTLCYDRLTNTYLCSVPENMFDDGSIHRFTCDTATINFTYLPIVRLHGTFGYEYATGNIDVIMPDGTTSTLLMPAKVKWRGGTTNAEGKHKRNYHIKFLGEDGKKQDRKFFGLRNDNNWLLDAGQVDLSRIRNRAAQDLWNDFATKPYYIDREKKALTATRGEMVEVFINDEYRGIYNMMENIDRSQLKIKKYDEVTGTIHGQIWKGKGFTNTSMWEYTDHDNSSETWGGFEIKYPDIDDVCPTDHSLVYDFVRFVCDASDDDFAAHIEEYIDMPAVIDYFVFVNALSAVDNYNGKNFFWACYDKQEDKKLTIAVWDLDCTIGRYISPDGMDPYYLQPDTHDDYYWSCKLFYRLDSGNVNGFHDRCVARWNELRKTYFTNENFISHYTKLMDRLSKSGAYDRETQRWSGDSDICGQVLDFANEREFIINWVNIRMQTFDRYGFPTDDIKTISIDNANNTPVYNIQGMQVSDTNRPGIYIRNGRKIFTK